MYSGHARLCVCLSVCVSVHRRMPHYYTDPDVSWGNGIWCVLVVHDLADLQSVHGFRCCDNIARTRNVSECLYSLCAWLYLSYIKTTVSSASLKVFHQTPLTAWQNFVQVFSTVFTTRVQCRTSAKPLSPVMHPAFILFYFIRVQCSLEISPLRGNTGCMHGCRRC